MWLVDQRAHATPRRRWLCSIRRPVARRLRKRRSDLGMSDSGHTTIHAIAAEQLPIWWRCVLIAMATIILCSCSSPRVHAQVISGDAVADRAPATAPIISVEMPADESLSCEQ